ncbi:calcium-activated potassium channel subunit beta-3-like isoform X1 [Gadus macrocephalus]|uniref:calcium-activated potassium channel subunit beta-3-like isoform X1 n=2 Tax=Gadus macrocephalus TaxID=80720 RepID=UPI0028CBBA1B|nr:calcium-activated potassium channel subunit beta-3-like isoform X1 [Gadus macrocephalus]
MFLSATAPRGSYNVPININLQGARKRPTRGLLQSRPVQEQMWKVADDGGLKAQIPVSSAGEDRAVLLGFTMMAFSVLMFFVVGITTVKPYLNSNWVERGGCVLVQVELLQDWVECRGVSIMPCLRVTVNHSASGRANLLHHHEDALILAPQCFYIPKCKMEAAALQAEALVVKDNLGEQLGQSLACLTDPAKHRGHALLHRKYSLRRALLWPSLMLGGGALLVVLVKLTQQLSLVHRDLGRRGPEDRPLHIQT